MMKMTSNRPYLIRSIHQWILDNKATPYIIIRADLLGVKVPKETIQNGKVVLNISLKATRNLVLSNHAICFDACFSGESFAVRIPIRAVEAIYPRENCEQGMFFDKAYEQAEGEQAVEESEDSSGGNQGSSGNDKDLPPHLTIIK